MLTGIIYGPPICCEGNYSTTNVDGHGGDEETIRQQLMYIQWTVYRVAAPVLLTLGLLGNTLTLAALSSPSFRGVTYLYLTGIAVADCGVLFFWMPIAARMGHGECGYYMAALYHAHIELVAVNTFMVASIFIMACLTVDRYMSVFFPARLRSGHIRRHATRLIFASFVIGFMVSIPLGIMRTVDEEQEGPDVVFTSREDTQITRSDYWTAYVWVTECLVRFCPTSIFTILNALVIKRFVQLTAKKRRFHAVSDKYRSTNIAETSSLTRSRGYREEQNLVILLTAIIILFFVTTTPSTCISLLYPERREADVNFQWFRAVSNVSELSNFAVNFYVYLACSAEFRSAVLRVFQGKCREEVREIPLEPPVGEIEDFSRHGTTFRMSPEHTKLNSPGSPSKANVAGEEKEPQ